MGAEGAEHYWREASLRTKRLQLWLEGLRLRYGDPVRFLYSLTPAQLELTWGRFQTSSGFAHNASSNLSLVSVCWTKSSDQRGLPVPWSRCEHVVRFPSVRQKEDFTVHMQVQQPGWKGSLNHAVVGGSAINTQVICGMVHLTPPTTPYREGEN